MIGVFGVDAREVGAAGKPPALIGREPHGATTVLALGGAKHSRGKRTHADLAQLEQIRTIVAAKHPSAADAKLLLFSAYGFDRPLISAADRAEVELIDMDRLYLGT